MSHVLKISLYKTLNLNDCWNAVHEHDNDNKCYKTSRLAFKASYIQQRLKEKRHIAVINMNKRLGI